MKTKTLRAGGGVQSPSLASCPLPGALDGWKISLSFPALLHNKGAWERRSGLPYWCWRAVQRKNQLPTSFLPHTLTGRILSCATTFTRKTMNELTCLSDYTSRPLVQRDHLLLRCTSGSAVKNPPAMQESQEMGVWSLGWEDSPPWVGGGNGNPP